MRLRPGTENTEHAWHWQVGLKFTEVCVQAGAGGRVTRARAAAAAAGSQTAAGSQAAAGRQAAAGSAQVDADALGTAHHDLNLFCQVQMLQGCIKFCNTAGR